MVRRIVANIAAEKGELAKAEAFYGDIFGLTIAIDLDWILSFEGTTNPRPQISIATEQRGIVNRGAGYYARSR